MSYMGMRRAAWVSYASIAEVVTNTADGPLRAHLFNSTVLPAMLYGAETWSLTVGDRQKLAVTERALERRMVGVKRTDHVSNELLWKMSKVKDAVKQAEQAKKLWAGHVARSLDGRWTRAVTEWLPLDKTSAETGWVWPGPKSLEKLLWPASKD